MARSGASQIRRQKLPHGCRDLFDVSFGCKVARIEQLHGCVWVVAAVSFGARRNEKRIVLTPDRQKRRLPFPKILLKCRVKFQIRVVEEEVQLDFHVAGPRDHGGIDRATIVSDPNTAPRTVKATGDPQTPMSIKEDSRRPHLDLRSIREPVTARERDRWVVWKY